ncbi:hypothetical protein HELRODRAFT_146838, partial [Helobdella robusta]|uniref:BZIP domain-containing protein n=1 Tax=Helobdella robusta TaxID=6412 RepID=T1EJU8_HELRO
SKTNVKDRKQGKPVPKEKKDESYWERRMKNNLSAKRSREIRRTKAKITEDELNKTAAQLTSVKNYLFELKQR